MISSRLAALRAAGAVALITVLTAALAACGGTTAPTAAPSTAATNPPPSASAAPSVEATAGAASVPPGVVGNGRWCLNTIDEVSAATGVAITAAAGTDAPGVGGGCVYTSAAGTPIYGLSVVSPAPAGMFEGLKAGQGAEVLTGIGDGAVLATPGGPLAFIKGQTVASVVLLPTSGMSDLAKARAALISLAGAAAGRM